MGIFIFQKDWYSERMKDKKVYIFGAVIVVALIAVGVSAFLVTSSHVQRGIITKVPIGINNDSGRKVVIKNSFGVERTVTLGGVLARNEACGKVIGVLKKGATVEYRLLPGGAFCAYDDKASLEDVYIKVVP